MAMIASIPLDIQGVVGSSPIVSTKEFNGDNRVTLLTGLFPWDHCNTVTDTNVFIRDMV
jgi:hypothetical protein